MKIIGNQKRNFKSLIVITALLLIMLAVSCDFQSPASFETPTWFMDLTIPLIQERYPLSGIVDDEQIYATPDSLGMQVVFEGSLPDTSIDESYLQVKLNQNIDFNQDPTYAPDLDFSFDTLVTIEIPFAPNNKFIDVALDTFDVPPAVDRQIFASTWNQIASAFDTTINIDINIPQVGEGDLPEFITSIDAIVITADSGTDSSLFLTDLVNNGLPTAVKDIEFSLVTDLTDPHDILATHTQDRLLKDSTFSEYTLLGDKRLGTTIRMTFGFGLEEETVLDTIIINTGDSIKVNLSFRIRIAGVDEAIVQVSEYDLSPEIPAVEFPSDIEIYSGVFKDPSQVPGANEIIVSNLQSTYLFDIDFSMNFRNFLPPTGEDSVKIETVLSQDSSAYSRTFDLDGYTFANPISADSALESMIIDVSAVIPAQQATIPLDGSEFGRMSLSVDVQELHFESLQANLIQEFPPTEQEMTGLPKGFSGMAFTDVQIEFFMLNQIQLPVMLDLDMIGIDTFGDSTIVRVRAQMGSPDNAIDTIKTVIRLSREGTTTLIYDSPSDSVWSDSTNVPPGSGESTIVDLLSFNPETMLINSRARIDGRGTIVVGASIGGGYRLIAPFEVRMAPMTFIPVNESPLEEWDYELRNKIRSGLRSASAVARVINHFPVGGEISILLSDQSHFPLDLSRKNLDSLAIDLGIDITSGDSLYIINECATLDPALGTDSTAIYIFNVMSDFSECVDGVTYFVRSSASGTDTVMTYVDTLLNIVLPDPLLINYDSDNDDRRLVDDPGDIVNNSIIDPAKIRLMTSPGDHYTTPRIHLSGSPIDPITGDTLSVFLSLEDYIEIKSFLTFEISSTGVMEPAPGELVIIYPNGGYSIDVDILEVDTTWIRWRTFGKIKKVDLDFSTITDPDIEDDQDWTLLESNWTNVDSFPWIASTIFQSIPDAQLDSVRIRISDADSDISDMSGWYFTLYEVPPSFSSGGSAQIPHRQFKPQGKRR